MSELRPSSFRYEPGEIATITLDRPDRLNALTFDVYAELRDLFGTLVHDESVKVVIVTGEGRGFCSGGDVEDIIGRLLEQDMAQLLAFTRMTGALIRNIRALPKPVIAATPSRTPASRSSSPRSGSPAPTWGPRTSCRASWVSRGRPKS